jgi:uridine kinase
VVLVDGFHQPAARRHARGRGSAEGFYRDSYDYPRLRSELLELLASHGNVRSRAQVFDHIRDAETMTALLVAEPAAVLLLDGIFLHRPELRRYWDLSVWLKVNIAVPRAARCRARRGLRFHSPGRTLSRTVSATVFPSGRSVSRGNTRAAYSSTSSVSCQLIARPCHRSAGSVE